MSPAIWVFVIAAILCLAVVFVLLSHRDDGPELEARLRTVAASGPPILETSTGGRIGRSYRASFGIGVAVYPGGFVLDGFGWGMHVVLASEILDVRWRWHVFYHVLEIKHAGIGCGSPVVLAAGRQSSLAAAIFQIAGLQSQAETRPVGESVEDAQAPTQKFRRLTPIERLVTSRMRPRPVPGHDATPRRRRR
jgi:hypothetical protein